VGTTREEIPVLLVTGPVGVGKTSAAEAVAERLTEARVPHALVDIDRISLCYPTPPDDRFNERLGNRNLASIWPNFEAAGATCLILARVVESRDDIAAYREAIPGARILVVRLRASLKTLAERVRHRERGSGLDWHLARAAELAPQMDRDRVEDLLIETDGRTILEIADEILERTGWPRVPAVDHRSP